MSFTNPANLKSCADCPRLGNGGLTRAETCCMVAAGISDAAAPRSGGASLAHLGNRHGLARSEALWRQALTRIPAGTQTLSKGPGCFVDGVFPKYLTRGKGARVWDADGNEFIDFCLACFPLTLGYGVVEIDEAIRRQLADGITFSMMHPLEVEVAEKLAEAIPCAEMVRYAKNGSDVTAAAVRLARHITGRDRVACFGYHGFQDWYIATTDRNFGIPAEVKNLTHTFRYNDIDSLAALFKAHPGEFACVIMEPAIFEFPRAGFLAEVKALAHAHGALLVFDEMLTGFRLARGGGQEFFGVAPDLATFGKGIANGMPLGVLAGPAEHMRHFDSVFFSTTYGGEALTLAAASAGLDFYARNNVIGRLWYSGRTLFERFTRSVKAKDLGAHVTVAGYPVRMQLGFRGLGGEPNHLLAALYQQEMIRRGILCYTGVMSVSWSHTAEELAHTADAFDAALDVLKQAIAANDPERFLEGKAPEPVFRALRAQKQTGN